MGDYPAFPGEVAVSFSDGGVMNHDRGLRPLRPRKTRAPPRRGLRDGEENVAGHFFVMPHRTARPVLGTMPSILSAR